MVRKVTKSSTARKAFFVYEQSFCGKWVEVIHYDDRPTEKGPNGLHSPFRLMAELSTDNKKFFSKDGSPRFKKLVDEYPRPEMEAA